MSIRKMNEHLKNQIEAKKIWFASRLSIDEISTHQCEEILNIFDLKNKNDADFAAEDFIENQNYFIDETKSQTALIQVKSTPLGNLMYDLPQPIRRSTDVNRPRKDNYTCLLMACSAMTHYVNIIN